MGVLSRLAYGLLLFMGFDMFINEGDQAVVGVCGSCDVALAAQD